MAKRIETVSGGLGTTNTYYLRSSVLGGRVVTELNHAGQKEKGYVFAGDQLLAEQEQNEVNWKYTTPLTGSRATAGVTSGLTREAEFDPMGVNVGFGPTLWEPSEPLPESSDLTLLGNPSGCGNNPNCIRCSLDGLEIGCDQAQHLMDVRAAEHQSLAIVRITTVIKDRGQACDIAILVNNLNDFHLRQTLASEKAVTFSNYD